MGRNATGVRAIRLEKDNYVIGMIAIEDPKKTNVLVVTDNGMGKRSEVEDYRITNRGGKGVAAMNVTEKTGKLIAIKEVDDETDVMIMTRKGITIRMAIRDLRIVGRVTQGVRLINLDDGDEIASVARIDYIEVDEEPGPEAIHEAGEAPADLPPTTIAPETPSSGPDDKDDGE
jgi:DNA gyrase subunit A